MAYTLGFFWALAQAAFHLEHRLPEQIENKPLEVIGTIVSLPEGYRDISSAENGKVFNLQIQKTIPESLWPNPGLVRLHFANPQEMLRVGDSWSLTVKLKRPHGYANPGSFDKERHYFLNRLSAEGYVISKYPAIALNNQPFVHIKITPRSIIQWFNNRINRIRSEIFLTLYKILGERPFFGILAALMVGTRDGISPAQWQVFRDTGTAHLVAISGLHIGLVAGFAFGFVRFIYRRLPELFFKIPMQIVAAFAAIIAAISYAFLAGFTVPTQRAVVMILVFMLSLISRRRISVWRSYFLALALVLLIDPLSCLGIGFWLSFSAVGVILYGMQNRIAPQGLLWRWARAQWVIFLGLIPVTVVAFHQLSWVAPMANLFAIPWVSTAVVPFVLVGGILAPSFPRVGGFFLLVSESSLKILWPCLEKCLGCLTKVTWSQGQASSVSIAIASLGILLLLAPRGFPARKLGIIFLLPIILDRSPKIPEHTLRFTILDVGQGLSAVIETAKHVLIFDTGPRLSEFSDTGERVVLPFLETRGIRHIDGIIISHVDNDHVGGLSSIAKKMNIKNIISSEPEKIRSILEQGKNLEVKNPVQLCHAGQKWTWDAVEFEILHPSGTKAKKRNDNSCVLRIQTAEHAILLTGDIEVNAEQFLIQSSSRKLASSILVVPHHGSKSSSSDAFIETVHPKYAIFPIGYKNRYGHPNPEILERYRKKHIILLDTVQHGAVSFELKPNVSMAPPLSYRILHHRFWHEG